MFTQPDMRLDIADQIQRERLAAADRHRRTAHVAAARPDTARRRPRRFAQAVLAFAGIRAA